MPSPATTSPNSLPRLGADRTGLLLGLIAVALFSLTLPFTRLAVAELDPTFVALGRALVAACLAGLWLWQQRAPLPRREQWLPLALVSLGCVLGFPWLTSIAMRSLPASHGGAAGAPARRQGHGQRRDPGRLEHVAQRQAQASFFKAKGRQPAEELAEDRQADREQGGRQAQQ